MSEAHPQPAIVAAVPWKADVYYNYAAVLPTLRARPRGLRGPGWYVAFLDDGGVYGPGFVDPLTRHGKLRHKFTIQSVRFLTAEEGQDVARIDEWPADPSLQVLRDLPKPSPLAHTLERVRDMLATFLERDLAHRQDLRGLLVKIAEQRGIDLDAPADSASAKH